MAKFWELKNDGCYCSGRKTNSCGSQTNAANCRKCCYNISSATPQIEQRSYSRFDGIGNDFPWNNTRWSNFTNSPASTITLSHYSDRIGPNSVLTLPDSDSSTNPDSDNWSNHPGFIGGTWWKDFWFPREAEKERVQTARSKINERYSTTGTCDQLTSTSERLNAEIAQKEIDREEAGRGGRRVARRELPLLQDKLTRVDENMETQCAIEAQEDSEKQMMYGQLAQMQQQKPGMSQNTTLMIGGVVILGVGFLLYRALSRPTVINTK